MIEGISILNPEEADGLFEDEEESLEEDSKGTEEDKPAESKETPEEGETIKDKKTIEVDPNALFDSDTPESVGSEDEEINQENKGDASSDDKDAGSSPNFYSSIADALKEEGVFPDLEDSAKIKTPEDFRNLIEQKIQDGLDENQKRVSDALDANVEPTVVKQFEQTISYLDNIKEESLDDEGEEGEKLRRNLIYLDYINKGFSKARATKAVDRAVDDGTDTEIAKEALTGNKEFFKGQYKGIIDKAKEEELNITLERQKQAKALETSILKDKEIFGELDIAKPIRLKIYNNIAKPVYKDPDSGQLYTAVLKYEKENHTEFLKNVGLVFTLTNGFKDFDGLIKGKVNKGVKKGLRELEHTINNTRRAAGGSLDFASGVSSDSNSYIGKGITIDV